jgi:uncharacterized membrane protein YeaQ/YmgE (transglycosylase-associated protein family)
MPIEISWSEILTGGLLGLIASFFVSTKAIPNVFLRIIIYIFAGITGATLASSLVISDSKFISFLIDLTGTIVVLLVISFLFRAMRGDR